MQRDSYWQNFRARRVTRRRALAAGAAFTASAAFLAACGGDDDEPGQSSTSPASTAAPSNTTQAGSPTEGDQGGKFVIQAFGDPGAGLDPFAVKNNGLHQQIGFTHDGLLELRAGTPEFPGTDLGVRPTLAQALPEQPDQLTFIYKLRPATFHTGVNVTSEDVKYSYDRYAFDSLYTKDVNWLEKVEAPDDETVIVTTKFPYADALASMAFRLDMAIHSKAFVEGPENGTKLVGCGPFLFIEYQPPVVTRYRRNPDYHLQPLPYFEELDVLGTSDAEKQIADFLARQVHMTYNFDSETAQRITSARPEAHHFRYAEANLQFNMRGDKPPFNDKRVRQAISMSIDRALASEAITNGEGEPDSPLSLANEYWGVRKPSELPSDLGKYWVYDPQAALQLLSAANVSLPIQGDLLHWDPTVIGQKQVDEVVLSEAQWRQLGVAEFNLVPQTFGQSTESFQVGNYDPIYWGPSLATAFSDPRVGNRLRNVIYWPAEGIPAGGPTTNVAYINNPQLNELADKQFAEMNYEARVEIFREMEEILAEEQYIISTVSKYANWFGDETVMNMQTPKVSGNGALPGVKRWWFSGGEAP